MSSRLHALLSKGKWRFILYRGVIWWGIPVAILIQLLSEDSFFDGLLTSLIIFPIVGMAVGYVMWLYFYNQMYK